jgi:hypothetical protein
LIELTVRKHQRDRRTLTYEGYHSLTVAATFLAALQSQLISSNPTSQVVSAFYFCGLITDILSAALCFLSARWFEMLNESEAEDLQEYWQANDEHRPVKRVPTGSILVDLWVKYAIHMAFASVWLGLTFLMAGVLSYAWLEQSKVVGLVSTTVFSIFALFVPPFMLTHSRRSVLSRLGIRRHSGTA